MLFDSKQAQHAKACFTESDTASISMFYARLPRYVDISLVELSL
jgi:hypothetical protein